MSEESGSQMPPGAGYRVWALDGIPEVREGDDLAKLITAAAPGLADGSPGMRMSSTATAGR